MKNKELIKSISIVIILALLLGLLVYNFVYSDKCSDITCFSDHLMECKRATYITTGEWAFKYSIVGVREGKCSIDVKLLFAGMETKFESIVGKSMVCSIPLKIVDLPEKNLQYCSGPLKENIQYLVIKELYNHITENTER